MKVGTAIRDITPLGPEQLCGYPESPVSTGVHDPLFLSAYYFTDGSNEALYLTADLCFFTRKKAEQIATAIADATGVPVAQIMLAATHTHYAPATDCDIYRQAIGPELCPEYMKLVLEKAVEAAAAAVHTAFEAKLAWSVGYCGKEQGIGGNRHDPEHLAQDPSVTVLSMVDESNTVRGVLVNYALHPTILNTTNSLVTADYVAYIRQCVTREYPDAIFGLMQGCSGNQSSRWFRKEQTFREAERFGATIGQEVLRLMKEQTYHSVQGPMQVKKIEFMPEHVRTIPPLPEAKRQVQETRQAYEAAVNQNAPMAVQRSAECTLLGAEMMELYAVGAEQYGQDEILATTVPVVLQFLTLDTLTIVGIGAEVFTDVGLAVKEQSPYEVTMISTVTGGCPNGYLCADYAYDLFCYESAGTLFAKGTAGALTQEITTQLKLLIKENAS